MTSRVRNDLFDRRQGLARDAGVFKFALWQLVKWVFFRSVFPWPIGAKCVLLRMFGAKVGKGVVIKPQLNIHYPWRLEIGDYAWLGEECFILNFELVIIGSHTCISQRAFLCGGNHDFRDPSMRYRNGPITVGDGAWIGAQVFVGPNVKIGEDAVVAAASMVSSNIAAGGVYRGNPVVRIGDRWRT